MRILGKIAPVLGVVVALAGTAPAQRIEFRTLDQSVIESRLRTVPHKDSEREPRLKELLQSAGCQPANLSEQAVKGYHEPNVICVLPGDLPSEIVVGAHFDHAERGEGVVDNWSGASLLADLLESLKDIPRRHTFVFVGFTAEERGLRGSEYYVQHLTFEQLKSIEAMINIDSVGMTPTKVWVTHSDPRLVSLLGYLAEKMKLPVSAVNVEKVGSADSESFAKRHIPVITFHSVTQENLRVLHSFQDNMRAISFPDYYATYKLIAAYLAACDVLLPIPPPPAAGEAQK